MQKKQNISIEDEIYNLGLWFLVIGSILFVLYIGVVEPLLPQNGCFFWNILHLYCPGCGGTRSVHALMRGDVLLSLWYHPLVVYTVIVFGGFMLTNTLKRLHILHIKGWKFHNWYLYAALGIVITNWVLRNVLLLALSITLS